MIKTQYLNRYDFISRSIGSVPTHDFDWDLDIYVQVSDQRGMDSVCHDLHRELVFKVAMAISDDLGYITAESGMQGGARARLIAISVAELTELDDIPTSWEDAYKSMPYFNDSKARAFRIVATISQTHNDDYFSERLEASFKGRFINQLSASLSTLRGVAFPYCETRTWSRSRYLIYPLSTGTLPERANEPQVFGFHELGIPSTIGLTELETPWLKMGGEESSFLRLKAQFTLHLSSQETREAEVSEVLLETLMSFCYQLGVLKANKGCPSWHLRAIEFSKASINRHILQDRIEGMSAPQVNVSIMVPVDADLSLNQAMRNKLRFFVDKDLRKTYGLTSDETELPNPHMQALVNNVFLRQFRD